MSRIPTPEEVEQKLRKVAQLYTLFKKLPHMPTPAEARLLAEFERFADGSADSCSPEALLAGFRTAWTAKQYERIVVAGQKFSEERLATDRDLARRA